MIMVDGLPPVTDAVLGRLGLEDRLTALAWGGMVLKTVGVGIVVWDKYNTFHQRRRAMPLIG